MDVPFHKPILPTNLNEIFSESVHNGWLTTGSQVKEFEALLADYLNCKYVVAVNSCTAALHLALAAKSYGIGDKFIAPTFTFVSTVEVGEYLNMEPVLVDSENDGFNIDLNQVEDLVKNDDDIKVILPVHFAGEPVNMSELLFIAKKYDVFILEDSAHALESVSNVGKVGDTDDAAAFSFYANKNITTGGEGGALATNDFDLSEKVRTMSLHGMSKTGWNRFKTNKKWMYDIIELGYKYNMTDISACFGIWQLNRLQEWENRRMQIVKKYIDSISSISGIICPQVVSEEKHAWHLFIIKIVSDEWSISRDELIIKLNDCGIGTAVHYIPVHMQSYYKNKYNYKSDDFPVSKKLSECVISLPCFPAMRNEHLDYITNTIKKLWEKNRK